MAQLTARTIADVLLWVESTPHHKGSWEGGSDFLVLSGHNHKLRIPRSIHADVRDLIEPGGQYDTRMYRATEAGRALLASATGGSAEGVATVAEGEGSRDELKP